jgi:hypothetical protein
MFLEDINLDNSVYHNLKFGVADSLLTTSKTNSNPMVVKKEYGNTLLHICYIFQKMNFQKREDRLQPFKNGAPDRIRTYDLCLRRATLYPAELRVRGGNG